MGYIKNLLKVFWPYLLTGAGWVLGFVVGFALLKQCNGGDTIATYKTKIVRDTLFDTIVVMEVQCDTAYFVKYVTTQASTKPVLEENKPTANPSSKGGENDTTIFMDDNGVLHVPITQKVYRDSDYTAYVSGYMAQLDSLQLYRKKITETITNTITIRKKASRWCVGALAGVGYGLTTAKPDAFVGVGVTYRLWPP